MYGPTKNIQCLADISAEMDTYEQMVKQTDKATSAILLTVD